MTGPHADAPIKKRYCPVAAGDAPLRIAVSLEKLTYDRASPPDGAAVTRIAAGSHFADGVSPASSVPAVVPPGGASLSSVSTTSRRNSRLRVPIALSRTLPARSRKSVVGKLP